MQIFVLSPDIYAAADYLCKVRANKMLIEYPQILSAALHRLFPEDAARWAQNDMIPRATHINHPCVKWATESPMNMRWLAKVWDRLADNYRQANYRSSRREHGMYARFGSSMVGTFTSDEIVRLGERYDIKWHGGSDKGKQMTEFLNLSQNKERGISYIEHPTIFAYQCYILHRWLDEAENGRAPEFYHPNLAYGFVTPTHIAIVKDKRGNCDERSSKRIVREAFQSGGGKNHHYEEPKEGIGGYGTRRRRILTA